jgi:hypothetical protein
MVMDEAAIIKKTQPKIEEPPHREENPDYLGKIKLKEWRPLYDYFKLDESDRNDQALSKIWQWAKEQAPEKGTDTILFEVIKLNNKLGSSGYGDNAYAKIENYITIWNRQRETEQELKEMETKTMGG